MRSYNLLRRKRWDELYRGIVSIGGAVPLISEQGGTLTADSLPFLSPYLIAGGAMLLILVAMSMHSDSLPC
jgi:hypothetical protein